MVVQQPESTAPPPDLAGEEFRAEEIRETKAALHGQYGWGGPLAVKTHEGTLTSLPRPEPQRGDAEWIALDRERRRFATRSVIE